MSTAARSPRAPWLRVLPFAAVCLVGVMAFLESLTGRLPTYE